MTAPAAIVIGPGADRAQRQRGVLARLASTARAQQGAAATKASARGAAVVNATNASLATPPPETERVSNGQQTQIDSMSEQRPAPVRQETFLETVERALDTVPMPENPSAMEGFRNNNGASGLRAQVQGEATAQAAGAQADIRTASTASTPTVESAAATPLPAQTPAPAAGTVAARDGLPTPRSAGEVSLEGSRQTVQAELDQEHLTDERLAEANDARFDATRTSRDAVNTQATQAPQAYRAAEQRELTAATAEVGRTERTALAGMRGTRTTANTRVSAQQREQMAREAAERRAVSTRIQGIFAATQTAVTRKLDWLSTEVDTRFSRIEADAKRRFEDFVDRSMGDWKLSRYGRRALIPVVGLFVAAGTWAYDKLRGIDHFPEIQRIFVDGKALYKSVLREGIRDIATLVETSLAWCQTRIAQGREDVRTFVAGLRTDLQGVGREAAASVEDRFTELRDTVNDRRSQLANRLVERYRASMTALDQRIEAMRAENRGLVARFVGYVREVLRAIREFRTRIMSLLAEVRDVVERIIERPIRFLGNLVRALRQGFEQFKNNIWTHLRSALVGWLFGTLAQAGIRVPSEFSLRSIIGFVLEILGITYPRIRAKVARIIGERNMALLERAWEYVSILIREGPIGLWNHIREELSTLWDTALGMIREYVISQIVRAAMARLVTMFNPAGAIVQAILGIYNTVMFFIERITQIMDFVRTIVRSLDKIERGDIGDAANWIERGLAQGLTLIISFLARFLGLGGIGDAIRGFVTRIQERVDRVIDRALERIVAIFRRGVAAGRTAAAAVLQWWRKRRGFTGADGRPHHVVTDKLNGRPKITVQSEPADLSVVAESQTQPKKGELQTLNAQLVQALTEAENTQQSQALSQRVDQLLAQVAGKLSTTRTRKFEVAQTIGGPSGHPPRAKVMWASVLTRNPPAGNSPAPGQIRYESLIRNIINAGTRTVRRGGRDVSESHFAFFKSAHLIAGDLYGPTVASNLANTGSSLNGRMETSAESQTGRMLNSGLEISYKTTVHYENEGENVPSDTAVIMASDAPTKRRWLGALVARSFHVEIKALNAPGGERTMFSNHVTDQPNWLSTLFTVQGPAGGTATQSSEDIVMNAAQRMAGTSKDVPSIRRLVANINDGFHDLNRVYRTLITLVEAGRLQRRDDGGFRLP